MVTKKRQVDVIDKILDACYKHNPDALFIMSLMHQYEERGSLSKKQLQGLLLKAAKVKEIPNGWLASLEAIILKMPTRDKTPVTKTTPEQPVHNEMAEQINAILALYPQHKRVRFFQSKQASREILTSTEIAELARFYKLLMDKKNI